MNSNPQVASFPKHVNEVISETFDIYNSINDDNKTYANCLIMGAFAKLLAGLDSLAWGTRVLRND